MANETYEGEMEDSIGISVQVRFLSDQSNPEDRRYVFSYTIAIHNQGDTSAQLLTREWLITDADGRLQEVQGEGVIGEQPHIAPGETHTYTSGTIIETPVGTMEGRYGMVSKAGDKFDAPVPVFRLAVPGVLN